MEKELGNECLLDRYNKVAGARRALLVLCSSCILLAKLEGEATLTSPISENVLVPLYLEAGFTIIAVIWSLAAGINNQATYYVSVIAGTISLALLASRCAICGSGSSCFPCRAWLASSVCLPNVLVVSDFA